MRLIRAVPLLLVLAACESGTDPVSSIQGAWDMVAFRSDGVDASAITGTMVFAANGTVTVNGSITFPGEPADTIADVGTWSQAGTTLTMTLGGDTGTWQLTFTGDRVVLQLQGDASASRLTLQRS
jgi:hypothetical protein